MISRRTLLKGIALAGGLSLLPLGSGWALAAPEPIQRRMVVILMRGAVDGLSIVTPYKEQNYYASRSTIALAPPGQSDGLLDLDGFFGLHPSLAPLMPLWQNKSMAFIHASGSPAETRSHFEAQDILETALLNTAAANQGWMNGLAQALPDNHSPTRVLSFGNTMPRIFQGPYNVATVPSGFKGGAAASKENPRLVGDYDRLYSQHPELSSLYKQALSARAAMTDDLKDEMIASANGAPPPDAFVAEATRAGDMMRQDPTIQLVFMDVGGWDTHVAQGNAKGQLASRLQHLGEGLAALAEHLGHEYHNTAILVVSEFGRTVAENGNRGTDHGHGNVAWLLGGAVRGGTVWGQWPGLGHAQLHEGRDLAVTTDFRSLIGAVVAGQFGLNGDMVEKIIPSYSPDKHLHGLIA